MQLFAGYQGIKNNMQFEFLTDNCHPKHVLHHPRTTFLILVATALGGCWALEQPGGSCFQYFPPFCWFMPTSLWSFWWNCSPILTGNKLNITNLEGGIMDRFVRYLHSYFVMELKPIYTWFESSWWPRSQKYAGECIIMVLSRQNRTMPMQTRVALKSSTGDPWKIGSVLVNKKGVLHQRVVKLTGIQKVGSATKERHTSRKRRACFAIMLYRLCILLCILFMLIWIFELVICFRHRSPYLKMKLFPTKGVYYTLCLDSGGFVWWVGKLCQGPGTSAPFDSSCDGVIQGNARVLEANLRLWVGKSSWSLHISP